LFSENTVRESQLELEVPVEAESIRSRLIEF